jgi:hypothetical protein
MTSIVKLSIQVDRDDSDRIAPGKELAYKYPDEDKGWQDPFGGYFTDDEQAMMDRVAVGTAKSFVLSAGTKWERTVWCRLVATFV